MTRRAKSCKRTKRTPLEILHTVGFHAFGRSCGAFVAVRDDATHYLFADLRHALDWSRAASRCKANGGCRRRACKCPAERMVIRL